MSDDDRRPGFIKIHRKITENPLWTRLSPAVYKVFSWDLMQAHYRPWLWTIAGEQRTFPAGSYRASLRYTAEACNLSIKQVRDAWSDLEKLKIEAHFRAHHGTIITIINWDTYQPNQFEQGTLQGTVRAHPGHSQGTQYEECKEGKEQSSTVVTVRSVLAADAVSDFPETAEAIREHYTVDDELVYRIISAAQGAKPGSTDEEIAEAVAKTYRNGKQRSPGLWLQTVPRYLAGHEEEFMSPAQRQMARIGRVVRKDGSPL